MRGKWSSNTRGKKKLELEIRKPLEKKKSPKDNPKKSTSRKQQKKHPNRRHWLGLEPKGNFFLNFQLLRRSRCCLRELEARRVRVFGTREREEREEREEGLGTHWELGEHIGNHDLRWTGHAPFVV
jgi:hypothetical protein